MAREQKVTSSHVHQMLKRGRPRKSKRNKYGLRKRGRRC